jgi:sulfur-oxidizing protein SoxY
LRLRQFTRAADSRASNLRDAQLMIRHPNNSGLQMDQISRLYTPAYFIHHVKIWQGDELVLAMEGSIGISEDPNIRFSYVPNGTQAFRVEVVDTDNRTFRGEWPFQASEM